MRARALVAALAAEAGEPGATAPSSASGGSSYGPPPTTTPPPTSPPATGAPAADAPPVTPPEASASETALTDDDDEPATTADDEVAPAAAADADAPGPAASGSAALGSDGAPPPTVEVAAAVEVEGTPRSARPAPVAAHPSPAASGDVAARVEADGRYADAFLAAFGTRDVSVARIADAIAAFVATIRSGTSAFDRFDAGDATALDAAARRGLALFRGRAGCVACHAMSGPRAAFTDHAFHNTGIAARTAARRAAPAVTTGEAAPAPVVLAAAFDPGRALMSKAQRDTGAFKTPTLRDVAVRAPYTHDGSFRTLAGVIRHYARGGFADPRLDPRVRPFDASDRDVADLVAFLHALTSDVAPGLAPDLSSRAARTELRFVDARGRPVVGLPVGVEPAGDRLPGDVPVASRRWSLTTDDDGRIAYPPARRTHMRLVLPAGVTVPQGTWIPDTCRTLTLPTTVAGRATLSVAWPAGAPVPAALAAFHEARPLTEAQRDALRAHAPATLAALRTVAPTFTLVGSVEVAGRSVARFEAWLPDACAAEAVVDVPLPARRVTAPVTLAPGRETRLDLGR